MVRLSVFRVLGVSEGSTEDVVLHAENNAECVVWMDWEGERVIGVGGDYFTALIEVRERLEALGVTLLCNGARRDVYPSQMQRQAALGRKAYVLTMPRSSTRAEVVDIFEPAPLEQVCSVAEQRDWFDRWIASYDA